MGGKNTRLIFHLSYPRNPKSGKPESVNANIPKKFTTVTYADFDQAVALCMKAGKNCYAGKSDMSSAFRHLPINKRFWCYLIMKARDPDTGVWMYFVDKCLPFGAAISCALFQLFADSVAFLVEFRTGKKLVNYLDDYFFAALFKLLCNAQINEFLQVCAVINFPVSLEKTFWGTTQIVFLGLLINTVTQTVSIPLEKIQTAIQQIVFLLRTACRKATLLRVQKLCGTLNFISRAIVPGRAFTRRLYNVTRWGSQTSSPCTYNN